MRDRQHFQKTILGNGITVYTYKVEAPIVSVEIQLPIGSAHSHPGNGFLNGSVHFLEHQQLVRSKRYPEAHQLNHQIGLLGGHFNGSTYRSKTTYWIDAPASEADFISQALVDRAYYPKFTQEDIDKERSVVANEREREKFYPGRSKVSQYYNTQFMLDQPYPLEQLYGSNEDLGNITVDKLEAMHQVISTRKGAVAIAVGDSDFTILKEELAKISTEPGLLQKKMQDTHWVNKEFRLVPFETVSRPTLEVAWIHPRVTQKERTAINFILEFLTNYVHGTLYEELRHEKGWIYSLDWFLTSHKQTMIGLTIPVNTVDQLQAVREILPNRIQSAMRDQARVEQEIRRRLNNQVYAYQTVGAIMGGASADLIGDKRIMTETDWQAAITAMADPEYRLEIADRFLNPREWGEIGFVSL